jgi:hypothetical protein
VYHWEGTLRTILADIDTFVANGRSLEASLANGGIVIEYNPAVALPPEMTARANELVAAIVSGAIDPPADH